jgi:hypothetical protein
MLKLDAITKSLEIKLAGAVATTQCPWYVSWVEGSQVTAELTDTSASDGTTNGATIVPVIAAPAVDLTRKLDFFSCVNLDTAAVVLTIQVDVSGTKRIVGKFTLAVGDQVSFTDAAGWLVLDANGNRKQQIGGVLPAASFPALTGDVTTVAGSLVTTIGALKVTNAMLAGSIASAKLVGTDIATVGTITTGAWNAGVITTAGTLSVNSTVPTIAFLNSTATDGGFMALRISGATHGYFGNAKGIGVSGAATNVDSAFYANQGFVAEAAGAFGLELRATHISGAIRFYTGGTALRFEIYSSGNMGMAAAARFFVDGGADTYFTESAANQFDVVSGGSGGVRLTSGATAWAAISDERVKTDLSPLTDASRKLSTLRTVTGRYVTDSTEVRRVFLIAQDVQAVLPEAVTVDADHYLNLRYTDVIPLIVAGHREHEARLAALEARFNKEN